VLVFAPSPKASFGPVAAGSRSTATVGSAVAHAAQNLKKKLVDLGADVNKPDSLAQFLIALD